MALDQNQIASDLAGRPITVAQLILGLQHIIQGVNSDEASIATAIAAQIDPGELFKAITPFGQTMDYYGVLGDGSSADMDRMRTAITASALAGEALVPTPGKAYNFAAQLQFPAGFSLKSQRTSPFVFHATDAFNSQDRPTQPGTANANCIYCLSADNLSIVGLKIVFDRGSVKNSWVNGLSVRGGSGLVIVDFEAMAFNSGYLLSLESIKNFRLSRLYMHDCLQQNDGSTGTSGVAARAAQTTAIQFDDNKLNDAQGNPFGSNQGVISNFVIDGLIADAATRASVGWQTDGINLPLGTNHVMVSDGVISRVDEGADFSGGRNNTVANVKMRDITFYALKVLYGASDNKFVNIDIDGVGANAIILSASTGGYADTAGNDFSDISVRRVGVFGAGAYRAPGRYDTNIPQGVAPQPVQNPAVVVFDNSTGVTSGIKNNSISLKSVRDCASVPLFRITTATTALDTGNKLEVIEMDASIASVLDSQNYYSYAFAQRMVLDVRPRQYFELPDTDAAINPWVRRMCTNTFTASHTYSLPPANSVSAGTPIVVSDVAGAVSSTKTLAVRPTALNNTDTINGSGTSVTFSAANFSKTFVSDGSTKWVAS